MKHSDEELTLLCRGAARASAASRQLLMAFAEALEVGDELRARKLAASLRRILPLTVEAIELVEDEL